MKSRLVTVTMALIALPLIADEAKKSESKPAAAPAAQVQDSPLVAAAKRSKRLGKAPANVITNETLKQTGANAHVTTTEKEVPVYMPPEPTPSPEQAARRNQRLEREAAENVKAQREEQAKKAAAARERQAAAAAAAAESGYFNDGLDPAQAEDAANEAGDGKKKEEKPPQD